MKTAPKHLDDVAQAKWREIMPLLESRGDLDAASLDGLGIYCATWSRWLSAEAKVAELGPVVKSAAGFATENPYLHVAAAAQRQLRQWASALRLTPMTKRRRAKSAEEEDRSGSLIDDLLKTTRRSRKTARN